MRKRVLITGGTGLIGTLLSKRLKQEGFEVIHLSREKPVNAEYKTFYWDINKSFLEEGALDDVDFIIHLAGAGIADKKWTKQRKRVLASSRIESAKLLFDQLKSDNKKIKAFISASAIGIYGFDTGGIVQTEDRIQLGDDFLATLTKKWEEVADKFSEIGTRVVKLRIGLVLSEEGGLLKKLLPLARLGLSTAFGSGEQYMSWIHIDDLVNLFVEAVKNPKIEGVYNAVAPYPVSNADFLKILSNVIDKPYFLPNTPKFLFKLVFGELASVITGGNKVSSNKIEGEGFKFQHEELHESLSDLLRK